MIFAVGDVVIASMIAGSCGIVVAIIQFIGRNISKMTTAVEKNTEVLSTYCQTREVQDVKDTAMLSDMQDKVHSLRTCPLSELKVDLLERGAKAALKSS